MQTLVMTSKIDLWLVAVAVMATAMVVVAATCAPLADTGKILGILLSGIPLLLLLWYPLSNTQYTLDKQSLMVRSGLFRWNIPVSAIKSVTPSRDMASAPALSLDRLLIRYSQDGQAKSILISPLDQTLFMQRLDTLRSQSSPAAN
jgi:hypothetical protein